MRKLIFKSFILVIAVTQALLLKEAYSNPGKKDLQQTKGLIEQTTLFQQMWHENEIPEIIPQPVHVEYSDIHHPIYTKEGLPLLYLVASEDGEKRASAVFNRQLERMGRTPVPVVSDIKELPSACSLAIRFSQKKNSSENDGGQSYQLKPVAFHGKKLIEASGSGVQGCIYSATALSQLITTRDSKAVLREAIVKDYPVYTRRIFSCRSDNEQLPDVLDWMVRYRMDCMKFNTRMTRWWEANEEFERAMALVGSWKKEYGGVHIMLPLHIYKGRQIVISNQADRDALKKVIKTGLENGVDRVMIQADDVAPFKNGKGYVLTSEEDKAQFANMAEAHCFLMQDLRNWLDEQGAQCELYYCPPFYTYEDNNLGDMGLYRDTPWEQDAFEPFKRDLRTIGKNMPKDVFVIWTGPNVRTRKITDKDFLDWKKNLSGRAPFLWDNTMYSHHPFTMTAMFTGYENEFPDNFHQKTAGNGIYINGDATNEVHRASFMTANDYLWNPATYNPEQSLKGAITSLYGTKTVTDILEFKGAELAIRRLTGEKQLKSDIGTLKSAIYKVRNTISKNPSYYMRIYIRLRALTNQLICSVPSGDTNKSFQEQIEALDRKRKACLNALEQAGLDDLVKILKKEMEQIPVFTGFGNNKTKEALKEKDSIVVKAITSGDRQHWFGYYDKWQIDPSGRYALAAEVDTFFRSPTPNDTLCIGLIDLENGNSWKEIGTSTAWGWQQGCMLQWIPGSESEVIWNDQGKEGVISRIYNIKTGKTRTLPRAIYTLSPDGTFALSLDFVRLQFFRPGYGYPTKKTVTAYEKAPDDGGIYKMDMKTGESKLIISYKEIVNFDPDLDSTGNNYHWFNHLLINPGGTRFFFLNRSRPFATQAEMDAYLKVHPGKKKINLRSYVTRAFTAGIDGKDLYNLSGSFSHFIWKGDNAICAWAKPAEGDSGFYIFQDKSKDYKRIGEDVMTTNGHITYVPNTNYEWILNDTYPLGGDRLQELFLFHVPSGRKVSLGKFHEPERFTYEWRSDLHPRCDRQGNRVFFDSTHEGGKRQVYMVDISGIVHP